MAFDTKKWLIEDLGFSADDADAMLPKFADRADKLEKGYLRQSDYSRSMNELQVTRTKLDEANAKLTADMAEWASLTAAEKDNATALRERLDKAEAKVFNLSQKATRLAEDAGIDPKTILGDDPLPEPKPKPTPEPFDPKPLQQQIGGVASYMLRLNAKLPGIMREHRELTGEELDVDAFVSGIEADIQANKTDNLDPKTRWEKQYEIGAKRTAASETKYQADLAAAEERGRVAGRSEAMLPNTRPVGSGSSPVFRSQGQSKLPRPQPADHYAGARAALASGKYRTGGSNAA